MYIGGTRCRSQKSQDVHMIKINAYCSRSTVNILYLSFCYRFTEVPYFLTMYDQGKDKKFMYILHS
jgi:hypothetical protein